MNWLFGHLVKWVEQAVIWCINQAIQSIADAANYVLGILPNMPTFPSLTWPADVNTWFNYGGYYFPFSFALGLIVTIFALWFAWLVLAIPLRWFKVIRGAA